MIKQLLFTTCITLSVATFLGGCSKNEDQDLNPTTNNNGNNNSGGSGSGGSSFNSNETINYTVEFISGSRAGTKYAGKKEGFSFGGFSTKEGDVESLYCSFYHNDSIVIATNAVLDANGQIRKLDEPSSDNSYVTITINGMTLDGSIISSQFGGCAVSEIVRDTPHPVDGNDNEVRRAAYTYTFDGTFKEQRYGNSDDAEEYTVRGTITTRLPK